MIFIVAYEIRQKLLKKLLTDVVRDDKIRKSLESDRVNGL